MTRRALLSAFGPIALAWAARASSVAGLSLRGKLVQAEGKEPLLEVDGATPVSLHGDNPTMAVLNDKRLAGTDFEAVGHFSSPGHFEVDPIQAKALFVHKNGKRLYVTYWCDVCYIRTYAPGPCWCCQKYTDLDLRETPGP